MICSFSHPFLPYGNDLSADTKRLRGSVLSICVVERDDTYSFLCYIIMIKLP